MHTTIDSQQRILLVEDEGIIALNEKRILESAGYDVTVVYSGEAAVAAVGATADPDLVLMDIDLGRGIDGTEAARRILERHNVPIVFLSSHTEPEIVAKTEAITSYGYIFKNSGQTVLLASLRTAFRLWDAHQLLEQANEQHARYGDYLRTVLDAIPVGFLIVNTDGNIEDVNRAYCESTGHAAGELLGQHMSERDVDEDPVETARRIEKLLNGEEQTFFARHARKDGSLVPLDVYAALIDTPNGAKLLSVSRDLSEEQRLTEEIETTERLQRNLFEQIPGVVYQYRYFPDGRSCFPMASRAIEDVYEVTPEEVREDATPVFKRIHPDDFDGVVSSIKDSYRELIDWEYDYRVVLPERGLRWLRGRAHPQQLEDGSVLWHGYITDITGRKEIERRLEKEREQQA